MGTGSNESSAKRTAAIGWRSHSRRRSNQSRMQMGTGTDAPAGAVVEDWESGEW